MALVWAGQVIDQRSRVSAFVLTGGFILKCLFSLFWHLSPYLLGVKVFGQSAWCHIFTDDTFLVLARDGFPHGSWLPLIDIVHYFVFCFLYTCFVVSERENYATFHVV